MIIGITGLRPPKIGGYKIPNPTYNRICQLTEFAFKELKPNKIITGMALGYDQWSAYIATKLNIPFIAALPFTGQDWNWPDDSQRTYQRLHGYLNKLNNSKLISRAHPYAGL